MSWKMIIEYSGIIQADTTDQAPYMPACVD